ncbi:MAG: metallophosphoesterase family protein [Bacillota bacterium]
MTRLFQNRRCRIIVLTLLVLCATLVFIQLFSETSFKYASLTFKLQMKVGRSGGTVIAVPPIGQLFLKSHLTPWQLIITLDEVDFNKLAQELNSLPPKQVWLKNFQHQVQKAVLTLFAWVTVTGLLGAFFVLLVFRVHPLSRIFRYQMLASLSLILLLIGATILTYQPHAIERPQYQGVLAGAPWAMNLVTMSLDNIEVIGNNLKKISEGLPVLFKQAEEIKNMGAMETDLRALHVSDLHNNPAAFDLIRQLVANFKIQFVIDTGDLTDYGTALEAKIIDRIAGLNVPYVFIPGNHDSPLIIKRLAKTKGVILIIKKNLHIYGLTIAGEPDPAAFSYNSDLAPAEDYSAAGKALAEKVARLKEVPDIIAVHNRSLAEELIGKVPLIIHGHDHAFRLTVDKNTVIDDAGTTGAAGIRGITGKAVPYSASILYWKKDRQGTMKLQAVDTIKINGMEGSLTIDRRTFGRPN